MSTDPTFCFSLLGEELQRNFVETLTNVVCSENNYDSIRRLDAYCSSLNNHTPTPLAILGEQGSGKSALLANWARNRQRVANDDEHIFFHAIGCSNLSCEVSHQLRRLIRWIVKQFTLNDDIDLSDDDKLPWMLPRLLERVSKKGKIIIVLDGIQNSKSSHNDIGLKWFPSNMPSNVRMIVSTTCSGIDANPTSEYAKQQLLKSQRICDEIERRKWSTITLSPTICKGSTDSIEQMLSRFNSEINGHMLNRSLALLFISRHGLHEDELFDLLGRMTVEDKKLLVEKLCLLGVVCIDTKFGLVLTMHNSILRNVVYEECITSKARESETRDILIEYFETKDPSPRYCEELPWQQQKNMSPNLSQTIVDLRVLDIMFNSDLKHELYVHLKRLVLGGNFDIVLEFNKSVEKWKKKEKPSSTRLALMCMFVADVLMYFDTKFAKELTDLPPFLRDNINQAEGFLGDLHDPDGVLISSSASAVPKTTKFYFYSRWLWVNWPLIALKTSADAQKVDPSNPTQVKKTGSGEHVAINTENTVRESALTRTEPLPEALVMKLEKMKSSDTSETQKKNSCTTTVIPFSNSRYEKKLQEQLLLRPSHVESLEEQKERDAKQLLSELKVERKKRESLLQGLRDDEALISTAAANSKQRQEKEESKMSELQKRRVNVGNLLGKAVSIESRLTEILIALDQCDPANLRRHEELEQQRLLAKQQICDVSREGKLMLEMASKAQQEVKYVKAESLLVSKQRDKIKPELESLQSRINEEEDRLKQARVKSFDPKAFSKKLQIEGILAKRRQDKMMRRMVSANLNRPNLEAMVAEHPMSKLVTVLGLSDPQDIAAKLQQGKDKALDLQKKQESVESRLKEKQAELNRLHIQLNQMDLASSCARSPSPDVTIDPNELLRRQNQLALMSKLTTNVKHYLFTLREKVQSIEQQHDNFHDFMDTMDNSSLNPNTNRVITLVKELCDDFLHPQKLTTKSSPARFANIRILAKDESESRFTDYASAEVVLGDSDKGTTTGDQYLNELIGFIDHSLSQESIKEQRLVNLRSPSKQGSKGIILDSALRLN